ncbi:MAG: class I SAM-dependent methyltransferase [Desulfovibrionaceae bacterium]
MTAAVSNETNERLQDLLAQAGRQFQVGFETLKAGGAELEVLQIQNMTDYLDKLAAKAGSGPVELPFWAKIWPTCMFMGHLLARVPVEDKALLEIGAGVGVSGLFAARAGYQVTLSDVVDEALLFARINALKNGLEDRVEAVKADFTKDRLGRRFDVLLGCEVLYRPQDYPGLLEFMDAHLAAEGEACFAMDDSRSGREFFQEASKKWDIRVMPVPVTSGGEEKQSVVYRLRRKS